MKKGWLLKKYKKKSTTDLIKDQSQKIDEFKQNVESKFKLLEKDQELLYSKFELQETKLKDLDKTLSSLGVEIIVDKNVNTILSERDLISKDEVWFEEFLAMKIAIGEADGIEDAISKINTYSGGHSSAILTEDKAVAAHFMENIDTAAVYHNASTRFTDGGQMGVGAELAISTDKLHHRGPLGLKQLVTNKYYVFGDGQVRV